MRRIFRANCLIAVTIAPIVGALVMAGCRSGRAPAAAGSDQRALVTIKELMENIIDPIADNVFDAVTVDVTEHGIVETRPVSDDDWAKVRQGAVTLAEATNLLKMPRAVAPPGDKSASTGPNAPELSPQQVGAKIDEDRARWNTHVDELRDEALRVLALVNARNADGLFDAGARLDKVCENCHLEYWYPGDRKAVLEDEAKRATFAPRKK